MTRRGLLPEVQNDICLAFKAGASYKQIAERLHVTKGQVAGTLWRHGLCKKKESASANNARTDAASAGGSQSS